MKNFYELLDINPTIEFIIELDVINDNGNPTIEVILNNQRIFGKYALTDFRRLYTRINLAEPVNLQISMSDKEYSAEKETAIIIKKLSFDNIDIIANGYIHYATYDNDHNNTPTNYLGFNGTWIFDTKIPFYQWLHHASGQGWLLSP